MRIKVKLFGALRQYLPAGSSFNSCELTLAADSSLAQVLAKLPVPASKPYLVIVNDEKLQADQFESSIVQEDDEIVLLPPIKGG